MEDEICSVAHTKDEDPELVVFAPPLLAASATNEFFCIRSGETSPNETLRIFGGNRSNRRDDGTCRSTSYLLIEFVLRGHSERNCQGMARRCRDLTGPAHRPDPFTQF